jgi:anaerobic magnesium-protoporphyrin IX monomethyl ester cyclase
MKVMFINPVYGLFKNEPTFAMFNGPPLGLINLAAMLESKGHECSVFDANAKGSTLEEILKEVRDFQPSLVGMLALTPYIEDVYLLGTEVKQIDPEIRTVVGGPHAQHLPGEIAMHDGIDFVCNGEGEKFIVELVDHLIAGAERFEDIEGMAYRNPDDEIYVDPRRPIVQDLESLPFPAYHLLNIDDYTPSRNWKSAFKSSAVSAGRGCPYGCNFCDIPIVSGTKYRRIGPEALCDIFERLYNEFGVRSIKLSDPTFTLVKQRVLDFAAALIERNLRGLTWTCTGAVLALPDLDGLKLMKRAGCANIFFGIEAGNPKILKEVKKITREQAIDAVKRTRKAGIGAHCSFILGLPGETRETMEESISLSKELKPDTASFSIATPFPGTPMYHEYDEKGFILHKEWHRYVVGPVISLPGGLTPEQLRRIYVKAHRKFYLRLTYILSKLVEIRNLKQLKLYVQMGLSVVTGRLMHKI